MRNSPRICWLCDAGTPLCELLQTLSAREREAAQSLAASRQQRHFALSRRAARAAIWDVAGAFPLEIARGAGGEPLAQMAGNSQRVGVSLSHAGCMAAACAWRENEKGAGFGVDVERWRAREIADSVWAFSRRERALLSRFPEPSLAAVAAWSAKEAAWKALRPPKNCGPESLSIEQLDREYGRAIVRANRALRGDFAPRLSVKMRLVVVREEKYLLCVARSERQIREVESWNYSIKEAIA